MSRAWRRTGTCHRRGGAVLLAAAALLVATGFPVAGPAEAASPADTLDTGDPPPPAAPTVPDGLDAPLQVPDDSVVEMPPPASPEIVPNANTVRMAWVGPPDQRPADAGLLTLQAAINAAPSGGTVSFDPGDYAFTGALTVPRSVTLDAAASSMLYSRFTVSGGGLALADAVEIGAASTGAVVTVSASEAVLTNLTIRNPTPVLRPTGVQLGAGVSGVVVDGLDLDGGGEPSSYGINLTTGSARVVDPTLTGVATGVIATAASTASGVEVSGGTITATTSGVSLGGTTAPRIADVEVVGTPGTGTAVDLAASTAAVVDGVVVRGFARGIGTATTSTGAGPTITGAVVDGTSREGIALGATTGARVVDADVTLAGAAQSTGILTLSATGVVIERPTVTAAMYGITTSAANTGAGPTVTDPTITAFGGITLGSTQGATVTGAVLDTGPWAGGTGVNTVNAGRVTITDLTATGYLYAVGAQSTIDPASDRVDITVTDLDVVGAPVASHAVYLLGAQDATVARVTADITGAALVVHQSVGVRAEDIDVTGHEGATSVTGASILRAYGSQDVTVDRASIDRGSYGFFYSATDGARVTNSAVAGVVEYGIYGRSVTDLDVGSSSVTDSSAVALLVTTNPEDGISHDIALHDNVLTGNDGGIHALQGTSAVQVVRNTASGQGDFVTAGPAHRLLVADNTVEQTGGPDRAAVTVAPLWQDKALAGSYSSSDVQVQRNVFTGGGTWLQVGTSDPTSEAAARRTLRDDVLVTGNVFPAGTTAVRTYANAVVGDDTADDAARALPVDGPVAVDARDHDDPNDWGSACRASGFLDDEPYYDGGGAEVRELTEAPVLYPMTCIDLLLDQELDGAADAVYRAGDLVSWTLVPHNDGPRAAPAGWTVTQLLPDGVDLVAVDGDGYATDGLVATAVADLPAGADGPPLRVTVRLAATPPGASTMRDVAYVVPAPDTDLDDDGVVDAIVEQYGPLEVPTIDTDTTASATDNDAQGVWATLADESPTPPVPPGGEGAPDADGGPATSGGAPPGRALADTGSDAGLAVLVGALLTAVGATALVASHGRRRLRRP